MNSATLRAFRKLSGLSIPAAAKKFDVKHRSYQDWEAPENAAEVKPDVAEYFARVEAQWTFALNAILERIEELEERGEGVDEFVFTIYRTSEALKRHHPDWPFSHDEHSALMYFLMMSLRCMDYPARCVWDDDPKALTGWDWR